MDTQRILLEIAKKCFDLISPKLSNYLEFTTQLTKVVKIKELENIQYSFDVELDNLIKDQLTNLSAKVFSEESGWFETSPNYEFKIVYDPFCNSSLATKSFREAAMGISIFTSNNVWLASLILDYQTGLIGYVKFHQKTQYFQAQTLQQIELNKKDIIPLSDAWSVITLESIKEREELTKLLPLISKVGRLIISSGHIYWLKLATGSVNVYTDPVIGEELYEMFAATVAQGAGCTITDLHGKEFNPGQMLSKFENDRHFTYHPVAASNSKLHADVLSRLQGQAL